MTSRLRLEPVRRFLIRTAAMTAKEALHIRRDPRTLYLALGMPVVLLLIFGYGVRFDIDLLPLAISDADQTVESRALIDRLARSGDFVTERTLAYAEDAERALRKGEAVAAVVIPKRYAEHRTHHEDAPVQLIVDGADTVVANQVLTKADAIVRAHGRSLAPRAAQASAPVAVRIWTRYNPEGTSALFMVPGLAAYLLAISAVMLTALTVAGEWEHGSMEQLFASPVGRVEIILGKLLPYLALGMLELLLVIAFGSAAFDVPMRGSPLALFTIGLFFVLGMLGQGLFISVVTKNQLVATQAGALSALLPSMLLSGMMFPIQNMPPVLQGLSYFVPARYLVHALRGILLKGNGLSVLWPDFAAEIAFALVALFASTVRFQRRLA